MDIESIGATLVFEAAKQQEMLPSMYSARTYTTAANALSEASEKPISCTAMTSELKK